MPVGISCIHVHQEEDMAQAIERKTTLPISKIEPYYTLSTGQNHVVRAREQVLQVLSGVAWVSNNGDDFVLRSGEAITLERGGDHVAVISSLFNKPVRYSLR
jgi:hypothetical protein